MTRQKERIAALRREAAKDWVVRGTVIVFGAATGLAWLSGQIQTSEFLTAKRLSNLSRFVTKEAVPYPLRDGDPETTLPKWIGEIWSGGAGEAVVATLWIAIAAITLAAIMAVLLATPAARTLMTAEPYLLGSSPRTGRWRVVSGLTRLSFVFMRAVPEYVLAFFLVQLLPHSAIPAVLALAIHNSGILGKLYGDTLENLPPGPLRALRVTGTSRLSLATLAAMPVALPRFLLYFFYRFETCVREATVLGMLGIASLGHEIVEARAKHFYDEMLLLVAFGVVIVLLGDLASHLARGWIRRAT